MRIKPIAFDIHGSAKYSKQDTVRYIKDITLSTYGIEIDLTGHDFQNYYRPDGAKVTKTLTTLLRKTLTKDQVAAKFAPYGKRISELYTTGMSLKAFFGDKRKLGSGEYESRQTCFREGSENTICKDFLTKYRRAAVLCMEDARGKDYGHGRCLVFFAGGRNIILTNFYYHGLNQNRLYFVEALRRILNLNQVIYRTQSKKFFLPIYKNGDALHVYDVRSQRQYLGRKLPCPHCGKMVNEENFFHREEGAYQLIGCSERCAIKNSRVLKPCDMCGEPTLANTIRVHDNKGYCPECWNKSSWKCGGCGQTYMGHPKMTKDGHPRCPNCWENGTVKCKVCGDRYAKSNRLIQDHNGKFHVCMSCARAEHLQCSICRTVFEKPIKPTTIGNHKRDICEECLTPRLVIPDSRDMVVAV